MAEPVRMAFSGSGEILAMQIDTISNLGGYLSDFAPPPGIPGNSYPYKTPLLHLRIRGAYSNTVPVDAYRGSGRPEATWTNERLIERGARALGLDAAISSASRIFPIPPRAAEFTIPVTRPLCSMRC